MHWWLIQPFENLGRGTWESSFLLAIALTSPFTAWKMFVCGIILVCLFPRSDQNNSEYVFLRIQSKCRKMRTRITPNTDTFNAVITKGITKIYWRKISKISFKDLFCRIHAKPIFNEIVGRKSELATLLKRNFYQGGGKIYRKFCFP